MTYHNLVVEDDPYHPAGAGHPSPGGRVPVRGHHDFSLRWSPQPGTASPI